MCGRGEALEQARREIYPMLCRSFARPHKDAVADLVEECRHDEATRRDTGYDPREDFPDYRPMVEYLSNRSKTQPPTT